MLQVNQCFLTVKLDSSHIRSIVCYKSCQYVTLNINSLTEINIYALSFIIIPDFSQSLNIYKFFFILSLRIFSNFS